MSDEERAAWAEQLGQVARNAWVRELALEQGDFCPWLELDDEDRTFYTGVAAAVESAVLARLADRLAYYARLEAVLERVHSLLGSGQYGDARRAVAEVLGAKKAEVQG